MTDFLDRLTTDSGTAAQSLRPIVPSRFEPVARDAKSIASDDALGASTTDGIEPTMAGALQPYLMNPQGTPVGHDVQQPGDRGQSRLEVENPVWSAPVATRTPQIKPAERPWELRRDLVAGPSNDADLSQRMDGIAQGLRELQGRSASPMLQTASDLPFESGREQTRTETGATTPPLTAPRIVPESLPARRMAAVERGPTVNVTIGRIEVKAAQTPAPAAQTAGPRARVMSLEQYLQRRRAAGGRT